MQNQSRLNQYVWMPLVLAALLGGCGEEKVQGDGLPGAPSAVEAEAADALALVRWTPPTTNGGNPLLYYVVRCEPVCGGAIVAADEMQATVRGLNNGIRYLFKVSAVNARGEGPASVPSESVMPMAGAEVPNPVPPSQPRAVRVTPGNQGAYVSWMAPASFGGRPLRSVRVSVEPVGPTVTVPATEPMVFIPDLPNNVPHRFKMVALNEVGESPAVYTPWVTPRSGGEPAQWVGGYYVGYQRGLLPMDSVDFSGMTDLIVGRFKPGPFGTLSADLDVTEYEGPIIAKELAQRAHAAGKKALMMLGGYGEHDNFVAATLPETRPIFVRSILKHMDELGYDGVDVDWEPILLPPAGNDGEQLLALLDDLRAARPDITIAVPVYWVNSNFGLTEQEKAFYRTLSARVDQLNIMSYKMSGNWGGWESWHSSPLEDEAPNRPTSVASSVRGYLDAGVPAGRLGVGIGFFGTCWRGVTEPRTPLADRDVMEVQSDNAMSYTNIMELYYEPQARHWDAKAKSPYLSTPHEVGPGRCNFITYEDEQSIAAKGRYSRELGLGGAIIWTINQGHLPRQPEGKKDPLLDAVKRAFLDR
ncbi:glycosyl hydrolase [Pyxidicoccus fallax]|uniref:chitinase n=1 Tax=Pyxidicoccus fallax TaxID=394095 RepID=A0A848LZA1_9BACT|nr:glycosyl hydrolase family 18 protein [Pyxidicoccus fallax]NMO22969.1 glycosyl hydrolase [Pyxidicoccus fallax]NPC85455.1 glycosyl hydrolase [Pyxidicoccus fallax]